MRFALRVTTAAVLVAGMAGLTALAQRGGGFGGGMFGGPLALLRAKSVQSDLNITEEQAGKLKDWAKDYGASMREKIQEKMKDLPQGPERFQKMPEIMAEINKETYKELGTVLKPEQVKRLKQIETQAAGARAFAMPDVQSALKLTADQKDKVKDIEQSAAKESRDLREEYGLGFGGRGGKGGGGKGKRTRPDPEKMKEFQKKSEAINKDTTSKVMAVLTDEQKKEWQALTGKPFDVAKMQEEMRGQFQGRGGFRKKKDD